MGINSISITSGLEGEAWFDELYPFKITLSKTAGPCSSKVIPSTLFDLTTTSVISGTMYSQGEKVVKSVGFVVKIVVVFKVDVSEAVVVKDIEPVVVDVVDNEDVSGYVSVVVKGFVIVVDVVVVVVVEGTVVVIDVIPVVVDVVDKEDVSG